MTSPRCKYGVEHGECGKSSGVGQQWDRQISQEDNEVVFVENDGGGESELFELPCTKEMRMRCVNSSDGDSGTYLSTLNTARKMTAYVAFDSQVRRTAAIKRRVAIADPEHRLDLLRKEDRTTGDKLRVCLKRESLHKPASLLSLWCDTENIDECRPRAPTLEGTDVNSVAPKSDDGCSIRFKCDMDQKPFSGITTTYEQSNRPIQQALLSYENYGDDFARMRSTGKKFKPAHSGDRMSADFLIAGDQTFDQVGGQRALDTESLDVSSLQKSKKNILVYNESLAALDSRRAASLKNKTRAEIYPELPIPTINFCRSGPQSPHRAAKRPHVSELRIRKIGQTGTGILPLDQETTGSASRSASFVGSR